MISVVSNGLVFDKWNSVSIVRSMDQFAATFSMSVFFKGNPEGKSVVLPLIADDSVEIFCDDEKIIDGYIEETSPSFSTDGFGCSISGKEVVVDAVKCPPSRYVFENKRLDEICRIILTDFPECSFSSNGVDVGAPFKSFSGDVGGSAYDLMIKACSARNLMIKSDGLGNVSIDNGVYGSSKTVISEGKNVLSFSGRFSNASRYSSYKVVSSMDPSGKTFAVSSDSEVRRNRSLVIVDEKFSTKNDCERRAFWERDHRRAAANSFSVKLHGWRQDDGKIWGPGIVVTVDVPSVIDKQREFLVNKVTYNYSSSSGTTCAIELIDVDAYRPEPKFESKRKVNVCSKNDVWASVRLQTGSKLR